VLVLVYHPVSHKNRGLKEKFDELARSVDQDKLLIVRYNGINESAVFKNPTKLPAIIHFTNANLEAGSGVPESGDSPFGQSTSRVKECTEY